MKMNYIDEFRALNKFKKQVKDKYIPTKIVIDLEQLPDSIGGDKRCIVYQLLNSQGELLISGQGWSLDDAFKEAKADFFDTISDED